MQEASVFFWGVFFGYIVSAPLGPVNIICLQRSLYGNAFHGFLIGLGAAFVDAFYGALAAYGLAAVHSAIEAYLVYLKIFAAILLTTFAIKVWRSHPHLSRPNGSVGVKRSMLAAAMLTLSNPGVFLGFAGLFTLVGVTEMGRAFNTLWQFGALLSVGIFIGGALWWATFAGIAVKLRDVITDRMLEKLNHVFASVFALFACIALISAIF
ncbi:hypothetical protein GCM10017044_17270 [Kordiimonas sediminis]|uniref:Lysine transporter LysE n=1 Tax=Kordiimonas sediminis TaxID=1735581 RepID=A0A919AU06_9PROT|nr:LysE family transporter [Kordiimonas sediminis]GHF23307.1 hypothetical protein GCM10017044_17270 [Kordiimonas sediminis]